MPYHFLPLALQSYFEVPSFRYACKARSPNTLPTPRYSQPSWMFWRKFNISLTDRFLANGLEERMKHTKSTNRWLQALPSPTVLNCNPQHSCAWKFAYQEEKFRNDDVASPRLAPEFVLEIFKFVFINHLDYSIKWRDQFQPHVRLQYTELFLPRSRFNLLEDSVCETATLNQVYISRLGQAESL